MVNDGRASKGDALHQRGKRYQGSKGHPRIKTGKLPPKLASLNRNIVITQYSNRGVIYVSKVGRNSMLTEEVVDVIHSPWCFIEALEERYKKELEETWKIRIREFNMWDIEDEKMNQLPPHISQEIRKLRDPHNLEMRWHAGGSIFFLNGERLDLSSPLKWPQIERILEERRK